MCEPGYGGKAKTNIWGQLTGCGKTPTPNRLLLTAGSACASTEECGAGHLCLENMCVQQCDPDLTPGYEMTLNAELERTCACAAGYSGVAHMGADGNLTGCTINTLRSLGVMADLDDEDD